jgi:hypothetical protein
MEMHPLKLKSFCTTKEMVSKLKRPPTEQEKIFASCTSDRGLITRIYRELKKLNSPQIYEPMHCYGVIFSFSTSCNDSPHRQS